ncbi:MAG: GNAT family N-acetyltransferase [Thermoplasmata archaeon]
MTDKDRPIEVRKAQIEDLKRINELTDGMHNYLAGLYSLELTQDELENEHFYEGELENVYVALDSELGKIVGYMSFCHGRDEWAGHHYSLEHITVDEAYKGQGIGKKLFGILAAKAEDEGANLTVGTLERNKEALDFYSSLGFKPLSVRLLLDNQNRLFKE